MKARPQLSVSMTRSEKLAGWSYLPFYLVGLSLILGFLFTRLGYDVTLESNLVRLNVVYGGINFLAVAILLRRFLIDSLIPAGRQPLRVLGYAALGFVLYYLDTSLVSTLLLLVDPGLQNANNESLMGMAGENLQAIVVFTVLLAPLPEEVLFRGLIFGSLYRRSRVLAYMVSVLAFSALHVVGYIGQYPITSLLLSLLQYVPASIVLAWIYERTDTLWTSILAHTLVNAISITALQLTEQMTIG